MSLKANPGAPSVAAILAGAFNKPASPSALAGSASSLTASTVSTQTVGQHYEADVSSMVNSGLSAVGTGLHFTAEAVPGVLLAEMASIKASHQYQAYQQIYALPWDPQGNWKIKANQIMAAQSAQANTEIRNLPMVKAAVAAGNAVVDGASAVGSAVVNGATYVGSAVSDGVSTVAQGVSDAGTAVVQGVSDATDAVSTAAVSTYKSAGRGFLGWLADLGQSLFDWASGQKSAFAQ